MLDLGFHCTGRFQEIQDFYIRSLPGHFNNDNKKVIALARMKHVLLNTRHDLIEITEGKHHPYGGKQYRQLKGDRDERRQRKVRLTAKIHRPVSRKYPAHEPERRRCPGDAIDKARHMEVRLFKAHYMVQTVYREG